MLSKPVRMPSAPPSTVSPSAGVGFAQPGGEADAAGNGVEFAEREGVFGQDEVGADDGGDLALDLVVAREGDEFGRLAGVEQRRDPGMGLTGGALPIEQVAGGVEVVQDDAELFEELDVGRAEREGLRGDAPRLVHEEAVGGHLVADMVGAFDLVHGERLTWHNSTELQKRIILGA